MWKLKFVLNLHSLNSNGIGLWCNGNTTVFGAVFLGSSPSRPTKKPLNLLGGFFLCLILKGFVNQILKVITGFTAWFTSSSPMLPLKKWASPVLP